jgi:N-acetylneuraminate lyase
MISKQTSNNKKYIMDHINGLIAAPFTPFRRDGRINLEIIPAYVDKLVADGLTGIFVCGSNGEGPNMTIEERMLVATDFKNATNGRLKLWVHVGHTSIEESRRLAIHAQEIGADAISSVAAFYFKPTSVGNLVKAMSEIAEVVPQMPFYYYHIPHLTGVSMDMIEFLKQSESRIPNLAGIKYTATTLWEYQLCLNYAKGKYDILYGLDEMLLPALSVGGRGAIGSTYTFAAPLYNDIYNTFRNGDLERARTKMLYMVEMIKVLLAFPPIPAQKAIMKRIGFDLGSCRQPLPTLSRDEERLLYNKLDALNFFEKLSVPTESTRIL